MDNSYNYYNLRLPESRFNIISRAKGGLTIRRLINGKVIIIIAIVHQITQTSDKTVA
jgi:hypothetical protein